MTAAGQLTAKPPRAFYANLTATTRVGVNPNRSAVWNVTCRCGATLTADAQAIKRGAARCPTCNPCRSMAQANLILAAMPGTHGRLERKTKLTRSQIKNRLKWMRKRDLCFVGKWSHADMQGSIGPVFFAGKGKDVPCDLAAISPRDSERRYRKRIQKAVQRAARGGKEDPRYSRHIASYRATETAKSTLTAPNPWFGALPGARVAVLNAEG